MAGLLAFLRTLRALWPLLFTLAVLGCGGADEKRAEAESLWRMALAEADTDPEVARLAAQTKDAEIAVQDARARLDRRTHEGSALDEQKAQQEALGRAVQAQIDARGRWQTLRVRLARAALDPKEMALVETELGDEIGAVTGPGEGAAGRRQRIAVIPKGTTQVFWNAVEAGVREAAADANLDVTWKGPITEDDRAQQVQLVQQFATEGVDGIVLAPLDAKALLAPVRAARAKGIPVVVFDSALDGELGKDFASFVATDNEAAGQLAGNVLAKLLRGKGKVVMLRYQVGSASTEAREAGFLAAIRASPDLEVTVDNRYGGATIGDAKTQALNLLDRLREANGVFCCNELTTHGMLLALQQEGLAGKLQFVGFDASPVLVKGVETGAIQGLIVQNPRRMGREAVAQMAKILRGETPDARVDTGATWVDAESLGRPEIQALLK